MTSLLIANRGEIAVRVQRAARSLGMRTVAVATPLDADAMHARLADEVVPLKGDLGYLDAEQLVAVAESTGCSLVHPGYGFLAEDASFATRCEHAGLGFVGPAAPTLRLVGDKLRARDLAASVGVPVLAATAGGVSAAQARSFLEGLGAGAAVVVKAVAGGGGRGMRVVADPDDVPAALERCASEAERSFGNGDLFLERFLPRARHIEVQVVGDGTGAVSHLWDRDCSLQRRHQKVVEIAPAVTLPEELRAPLWEAARVMASEVDYRGLGTIEFLVDADDPTSFAFLEMNPRIQVEHTVTEEVTGLDLVTAQLRLAGGSRLADLDLDQSRVPRPRGIAVECRVNLETLRPDGTAHATSGRLETFTVPTGRGVRVDTGARPGQAVTAAYDSLAAKVVTHVPGTDLGAALMAAVRALEEFDVVVVPTGRGAGQGSGTDPGTGGTNLLFLRALLMQEVVRRGAATTTFVDDHLVDLLDDLGKADGAAAPGPTESARGRVEGDDGADGADGVVRSRAAGAVVAVMVEPGERVGAHVPLFVLESMKMEHLVTAPMAGTVRHLAVAVGDVIDAGSVVAVLEPDAEQAGVAPQVAEPDPDLVRDDVAEVLERHRMVTDEARPDAVARRRRTGQRTARENVADLCDPGSFTEYGGLVVAAQRQRRSLADLIERTPADGIVTGIGTVGADQLGAEAARCVVMAYDDTVLAGTQGLLSHRKTDRMLALAETQRLPVVLFAEGGGGRPGDTDTTAVAGLDVPTFASMGRLNGLVPTVGIASGRCFAGNAALLGCCDVVIATRDATIGMGGPAMIEGGGLGRYRPEEVGPVDVQAPNGVVDLVAEDEAEAVEMARRYLAYVRGLPGSPGSDPGDVGARQRCADQRRLRHAVPENRVRVYDVRRVVELLADTGSVLELRREFAPAVVTALVRIAGRPLGLVANNPVHLGGAIDADAADKATRFMQLCDAHGLAVVSLVDTPGFMVGPDSERTATVRHVSRLFVTGGHLQVPVVAIVLRKGYGLGAMAMVGGGFHVPAATVAWPTGEIGGMGLEGAVRLGYRRELAAIADPDERERLFADLLAEAYDRGRALSAATVFELDDVIDPADTREWIGRALPPASLPVARSGPSRPGAPASPGRRARIDTW